MYCLFFCCFFGIVHQHNLGSWFWVTLPALALWLCLWRDRRIGIVGRFAPLRLNALERRRGWNTAENNLEPNLLRPWRNTATHFLWSSAANPLLQARQCLEMPNKVDFRRFSRTWMDLVEPRDNRAQASFSSVNLQKSFLRIWTTIFLDLKVKALIYHLGHLLMGTHWDPPLHPEDPPDPDVFGPRGLHCDNVMLCEQRFDFNLVNLESLGGGGTRGSAFPEAAPPPICSRFGKASVSTVPESKGWRKKNNPGKAKKRVNPDNCSY